MSDTFFRNAVRERWARHEVAVATTLRQLRGPDAAYIAPPVALTPSSSIASTRLFRRPRPRRFVFRPALSILPRSCAWLITTGLVLHSTAAHRCHRVPMSRALITHRPLPWRHAFRHAACVRSRRSGRRALTAICSQAESMREQDASIIVVAMLESRAGVAAAHEIAAVDGIDALVVGNSDLAAELGLTGQSDHSDIMAANEATAAACRRAKGLRHAGTRRQSRDAARVAQPGRDTYSCGYRHPLLDRCGARRRHGIAQAGGGIRPLKSVAPLTCTEDVTVRRKRTFRSTDIGLTIHWGNSF